MSEPTAAVPLQKAPFAWQPLTPAGVAAFAKARTGRLWLVQFVVALIVAATALWLVRTVWFPVVMRAIEHLPPKGEIRAGQLAWEGPAPVFLAESRFLAFSVDPDHSGRARSPAHFYLEFGRSNLRVYSLFGFVLLEYPRGYVISFGREQLLPWWGAWSPALLALLALGMIFGLLLSWAVLAILYAGPAWLIALYSNRQASLAQCWRLGGAALLPGALFMCAIAVLYRLAVLDLVLVVILFGAHFVIGWGFLWLGVLELPLVSEAAVEKKNPFVPAPSPAPAAPASTPPDPNGDAPKAD